MVALAELESGERRPADRVVGAGRVPSWTTRPPGAPRRPHWTDAPARPDRAPPGGDARRRARRPRGARPDRELPRPVAQPVAAQARRARRAHRAAAARGRSGPSWPRTELAEQRAALRGPRGRLRAGGGRRRRAPAPPTAASRSTAGCGPTGIRRIADLERLAPADPARCQVGASACSTACRPACAARPARLRRHPDHAPGWRCCATWPTRAASSTTPTTVDLDQALAMRDGAGGADRAVPAGQGADRTWCGRLVWALVAAAPPGPGARDPLARRLHRRAMLAPVARWWERAIRPPDESFRTRTIRPASPRPRSARPPPGPATRTAWSSRASPGPPSCRRRRIRP